MKNLFAFCLLACLCISTSNFAQSNDNVAKAVTVSEEDQSIVSWEAERHDFGEIPQGTPVKTTFAFQNLKDEPLLIDNVRTSCGCTAPSWTKDPILPGEKSVIDISYNAAKEGKFNKVIKVFLKGQKEAEILIIQGEVKPKG